MGPMEASQGETRLKKNKAVKSMKTPSRRGSQQSGDSLLRKQHAMITHVAQALTTTLAAWQREQVESGEDSRLTTQAMLVGLECTITKLVADKAGLSDREEYELQRWIRQMVQGKIDEYVS
jgi:hypothetical protein